MPIQTEEHQQLVNDILKEFGSRPYLRIWKRVVGFDRLKKIKYGHVGECDIDGIMMNPHRRVAIEVKTGGATLDDDQIKWRNMQVKFGSLYILARSLDDVEKAIRKARMV